MTTAALDPRAGRRCHNMLNSAALRRTTSPPDLGRELAAIGVTHPRAVNFAVRAAAMGPVGAGAVTATFYNYKYELVAEHVPAVWETASPEAGPRGTRACRRRDAAPPARRRDRGVRRDGRGRAARAARRRGLLRAARRPLYAAHADLPVPEEPHLAYWHAATLLREHRGDGHLAALLSRSSTAVEALVSHTATGKGMAPKWVFATRGWTREDWDAAVGAAAGARAARRRRRVDRGGRRAARGDRGGDGPARPGPLRASGRGGVRAADGAGDGLRAGRAHRGGVPGGSDRQGLTHGRSRPARHGAAVREVPVPFPVVAGRETKGECSCSVRSQMSCARSVAPSPPS